MTITRKCSSSILQNALQLDDKMILLIVSTSDYVLSNRNHKHLITTRKQFQDYSLVCVMMCKMEMTGHVTLNRCVCPCADAGLWVAMGTGMQL